MTAIATRRQKKRDGDWTGIQGNFGPPGPKLDLSPIAVYEDYRELLADPAIDLVDICLPVDQHEAVTLEAIAAGKHVFVEKPIAIEKAAADRMVKAAEKAGVQLMVGQVLPFFPEFRWAAETIESGKYGKLLAGHFRRVITPPSWSSDMSDFRRVGGWGIDLHIHDNHFISLVCGVPTHVVSRGILEDGLVNHVHTQYCFEDPSLTVSCVSGGIAAKGLVFAHGFELYLENATLLYEAGTIGTGKNAEWRVLCPPTLLTQTGQAKEPRMKGGTEWCSAFTNELQAAVNGIGEGTPPRALSGALARDALKICHAEAQSIATGRTVRVR